MKGPQTFSGVARQWQAILDGVGYPEKTARSSFSGIWAVIF
jgi:hypothetical protein